MSLYWWWLLNLRKVMLPSVSPTSQNRRKELGLVITGQVSYWLWPNREQILFLVPESKKYLFLIDNDPERRDYLKHWNIIQLSTLWPEKESREWLISITSPIHLRGERWIITWGAPDQLQEQGQDSHLNIGFYSTLASTIKITTWTSCRKDFK